MLSATVACVSCNVVIREWVGEGVVEEVFKL